MASVLVLTNLGEKMSDDEVDELLKAVDTSSGEINYTGKSRNSLLDTPPQLLTTVITQTSSAQFSQIKQEARLSTLVFFVQAGLDAGRQLLGMNIHTAAFFGFQHVWRSRSCLADQLACFLVGCHKRKCNGCVDR